MECVEMRIGKGTGKREEEKGWLRDRCEVRKISKSIERIGRE